MIRTNLYLFSRLFIVLVVLPVPLLAFPSEDHWTGELDSNLAQSLADAEALIHAQEYTAARLVLEDLAKSLPANADVFNLLGFAYRHTDSLDKSAMAYKRALFLKPDHPGALEYQGELYLALGNLKAAQKNLEKLREVCPSPCEETDELAAEIDALKLKEM